MADSSVLPRLGQRWISETEPELGLGRIEEVVAGHVVVQFPAAETERRYALSSAPLRRVAFQRGDRIFLANNQDVQVESVAEKHGRLFYLCDGQEIDESELSDSIHFSKPQDRFLAGQVDDQSVFSLRAEALYRRFLLRSSPARGFVGARVELLPHQLFIASEVAGRVQPRVLLADEVGLGKTIEAGLILHRLHLTGRAERVLVLAPEPLLHQWFVELLRRFHLSFSLYDEERCAAIEQVGDGLNPFFDSQLILCSLAFLTGSENRAAQAVSAGWDLLIVDEAHHLVWNESGPSADYLLVESLAKTAPGVLLLTATPQQLGLDGHFARLRLLDPARYDSLENFLAESAHYERLAKVSERVLNGTPLRPAERKLFSGRSQRLADLAAAWQPENSASCAEFAAALVDSFGTGRVLFRNSRNSLKGFPQRRPHLYRLAADTDGLTAKARWLAELLQKLDGQKLLVIGHTAALAEQVLEALRGEINVTAALFHEGSTLLQRDRAAAWFAEEDGAQVLICSEIGSEGRNFQFAHHLALIDLPEDPEVLEQRIGRLDRIGQTSVIHIHVPYIRGTAEEVLAHWYHEGLAAFSHCVHGVGEITEAVSSCLQIALESPDQSTSLRDLLVRTVEERKRTEKKLARGYDRLLELNTSRPEKAAKIIRKIEELDADRGFAAFVLRLLDHLGMAVEKHGPRSFVLRPGNLLTDSLPAVPEDGITITFDRRQALIRDDMAFLSQDHPLVRGALDWWLGGDLGKASLAVWDGQKRQDILLEAYFLLECIAPPALHVDRFLPATPLRVVVNVAGRDHSSDRELLQASLTEAEPHAVIGQEEFRQQIFPALMENAAALAESKVPKLKLTACAKIQKALSAEIQRLRDLAVLNDHVNPSEIASLDQEQEALLKAVNKASLRLDCLRVILLRP